MAQAPNIMLYVSLSLEYLKYSEAQYFADQSGVFEITTAKDPTHGNVMAQVCVF